MEPHQEESFAQVLHKVQEVSKSFFHACEENERVHVRVQLHESNENTPSSSHPIETFGFDQLQVFLRRVDVIDAFGTFLQYMKELPPPLTLTITLSPKDVLVMYAFAYFDIEPSLKDISKQLLYAIMDKVTQYEVIQTRIYQYEVLYLAWQGEDRQAVLEKLSHMYWEYEINYQLYKDHLSPEESAYYQTEKQQRQEECMRMMKRIDNLEYFHQYTPVFLDSQVSSVLLQVLRTAFWSRIREALLQTPPDLEGLYALFEEIHTHLHIVAHRLPGHISTYEDLFDIEFFRIRESGMMTIDFWKPRCDCLYELLVAIDSEARQDFHRQAMEKLEQNLTIPGFIEFLEYFMTRLVEIVELYRYVFENNPLDNIDNQNH